MSFGELRKSIPDRGNNKNRTKAPSEGRSRERVVGDEVRQKDKGQIV